MNRKITLEPEFKHGKFVQKIQKQFMIVLAVLFVAALAVNLGLLTIVGTKGEELGKIRAEQEHQKLENDVLRSKVEAQKVSSEIEIAARNNLKMVNSNVTVVDHKPNIAENGR